MQVVKRLNPSVIEELTSKTILNIKYVSMSIMANFNVCLFIVFKPEAKLNSGKAACFCYILQKLIQQMLRGFEEGGV